MVQTKRKSTGEKDFVKKKKKVGKSQYASNAETNTDFKAKKLTIRLSAELKVENRVENKNSVLSLRNNRNLNLIQLLARCDHHNEKQRKDSVLGILQLIQIHNADGDSKNILNLLNPAHFSALINRVLIMNSDSEKIVRQAARTTFIAILSAKTDLSPYMHLILAQLASGISNPQVEIRENCMFVLHAVLTRFKASYSKESELDLSFSKKEFTGTIRRIFPQLLRILNEKLDQATALHSKMLLFLKCLDVLRILIPSYAKLLRSGNSSSTNGNIQATEIIENFANRDFFKGIENKNVVDQYGEGEWINNLNPIFSTMMLIANVAINQLEDIEDSKDKNEIVDPDKNASFEGLLLRTYSIILCMLQNMRNDIENSKFDFFSLKSLISIPKSLPDKSLIPIHSWILILELHTIKSEVISIEELNNTIGLITNALHRLCRARKSDLDYITYLIQALKKIYALSLIENLDAASFTILNDAIMRLLTTSMSTENEMSLNFRQQLDLFQILSQQLLSSSSLKFDGENWNLLFSYVFDLIVESKDPKETDYLLKQASLFQKFLFFNGNAENCSPKLTMENRVIKLLIEEFSKFQGLDESVQLKMINCLFTFENFDRENIRHFSKLINCAGLSISVRMASFWNISQALNVCIERNFEDSNSLKSLLLSFYLSVAMSASQNILDCVCRSVISLSSRLQSQMSILLVPKIIELLSKKDIDTNESIVNQCFNLVKLGYSIINTKDRSDVSKAFLLVCMSLNSSHQRIILAKSELLQEIDWALEFWLHQLLSPELSLVKKSNLSHFTHFSLDNLILWCLVANLRTLLQIFHAHMAELRSNFQKQRLALSTIYSIAAGDQGNHESMLSNAEISDFTSNLMYIFGELPSACE